jgi:S-adenosylmethionine/arginine decarboxylase-like enzyme
MEKNHKHLILNATVKNPIMTGDDCNCWLAELVNVIDMDILIPPSSTYCDIEGNEGVTGTVVITTSHISIHIWSKIENPYIRLDVYSCKDFCSNKVLEYVENTMGIIEEGHLLLDRNEMKPKIKCCHSRSGCQAKEA